MLKNEVTVGDPATAYYRKCSAFTTLLRNDVEGIDLTEVKTPACDRDTAGRQRYCKRGRHLTYEKS
ncbi:MAG: hypothetical protein U5K84_00675 [Alkalibacterium sp.]|nr:hypothetical protein [Alkalibacterium sp.]